MKRFIFTLSLILLSGCSQQHDNQIDTIWKNKTKFVGDNRKVIRILKDVGAKSTGAYKFEIEFDKESYNLKIHFEDVKNMDTDQVDKIAAVTLGLVGNV